MAERVVKVALIGCGRVAGHHLRSIAQAPGGKIVAVCDLVAEKARAYGDQYGVKWFTDYHVMLRETPEIDIVAIITPSGAHHEHAMDVMRRYKKHLIVEKPTFMHPAQLHEAYEYAKSHSLKIFPVFQNRHNKAVQRVKRAVQDGELGAIRIVAVRTRWCRPQRYYDLAPWRGTYSHDGGCLSNQAIHHIDLLRYLGGEVGQLSAVLRTLGADIEVEDTAVAALKYSSGAIGNVEATTAARPTDYEASLSIVCEKGLAQVGGLAVNELQILTPDPGACAKFSEKIPDAYGFGHITVYRNIIADMNGIRPFIVSREDCLGTLNLLHAFYRSDEIGNWVDVAAGVPSDRLGRPNEELAKLYHTPPPCPGMVDIS
jgi:UDP-N-acetyl-2-amino-2-deoxyglucuronate dehydrogenase